MTMGHGKSDGVNCGFRRHKITINREFTVITVVKF